MNFVLITTFGILGMALLAGAFIYLAVLGASGWRKQLETVLLPLGFRYCESKQDKADLARQLTVANPRHRGGRLVMHAFRRSSAQDDYEIYVCDYRFASASGRARGAQWILVCLISRHLALPWCSLESVPDESGLGARLFRGLSDTFAIPGLVKVATDDPAMRSLLVYTVDGRPNLPAGVPELLKEAKGTCLDAKGQVLILSNLAMTADRVRNVLDPQKLLGQMHLAGQLHAVLRL